MNVLFFLTPKDQVDFVTDQYTLRQALEKMEYHRYSSIPLLNKKGQYIGTLTEGDLLYYLKNKEDLNLKAAEDVKLIDIPRHRDNQAIRINTNIEDLIFAANQQNFIPVLDDQDIFIGIITRKAIITYIYQLTQK